VTFTTDFSGQHFLPIGSCIAEFEIKGLIGEGGFGTVYLAFDHSLLRTVALKEFLPTALAQRGDSLKVVLLSERNRETFEAGMKSFINEARLLAQFDHPALVKVYRFWESNNTAYMVMPFYEGISLKQVIHEHPERIDEPYLRGILAPLLDALEHLHQSQIYHRDIAPDNIMILDNGMPVLLDFGAARRVMKDMTQALTIILKPGFAPIEQYADDPSLKQGSWTDIYGLCAVLYYAILHKTPPTAVSRMVKDNMQALVGNPALAHFSQKFLAAIDAGLAVNPEDRIQTTEQFRHRMGLRTYILPGTNPQSVPGKEVEGNAQKSETVMTSERDSTEDSAATKLLVSEEPQAEKQPESLSHRSPSAKDEQPTELDQNSAEKLENIADSDQTIVIFNPPKPSSPPEAFSIDPAASTIHLPSLDSSAPKQSPSHFFTKVLNASEVQAVPAAEDLMATRILNPEALRKVMEAEREEARKREFDQGSKKPSSDGNSLPLSVVSTQDQTTRILPSSKIKPKSEQPLNRQAPSRPSRPKLVPPSSKLPKVDATKAKNPDSPIKPLPKAGIKSKRPVLFIIVGGVALMALLGAIGLVSLQKSSKTNNTLTPVATTLPPTPQPPVAVEVVPSSPTSTQTKPSDSNSVATVTSLPVSSEVTPVPVQAEIVQQAPAQALPGGPAQGEKPQENPPAEVVKTDLPEKSPEPTVSSEKSKPRLGTVHLTIKPWGTVTVEGTNRGVSPPLKTLTLPEGRYAVKIENPGFPPFVTTIEIKKGKTLPLSYNFSSVKKTQTP